MAAGNRNRAPTWLMVALLSSCAATAPNSPDVKIAAPAAAAPRPLPPVTGQVPPQPGAGIGPFDSAVQSMIVAEGTIAISMAGTSSVRLLDAGTGQLTAELASPTPNVVGMRFSADGKYLAAISQRQNEVYIWDLAARTPARTLRAASKVWGAVPLRGGAQVALAGEQGGLVIAAIDTGQAVRSFPVRELFRAESAADRLTVYGLAMSKSGQWLSAVVGGHSVILVDLDGKASIRAAGADEKMQLSATEFSPDGRFVMARGSSFTRPQMVEVGRHAEGAEATAGPSNASCTAAIIATGLIGYAICSAIVAGSAPTNEAAAPRRPRGGSGPDDREPTVDITGMAGELMLWRVSDPSPIVAKTFGRTFEQMAWSKDSSKVALLVNAIQDREIVKRVLVFQRSEISGRSSALPSPVESVTLGRPHNLLLGAIASDPATLLMERSEPAAPPSKKVRYTIERWPVRGLLSDADDADDPSAEAAAEAPRPSTAPPRTIRAP